jgi:hypothetical protein
MGSSIFSGHEPNARLPPERRSPRGDTGAQPIHFNATACLTTGTDILAKQAIDQLGKWGCFWVTVAWGFLLRVFFYVTLVLGSNNKRR